MVNVSVLFSCGTKAIFQNVEFELETIDALTYKKDKQYITIYKRNISYLDVTVL